MRSRLRVCLTRDAVGAAPSRVSPPGAPTADASVLHLRPPVPGLARPASTEHSDQTLAANLSMYGAVSSAREQKKTAPVRADTAKP